ncbi:MAG: acyl-ACP--UDP-N-acetylglucosamine O-acyltransferase [Desulfarculaceae bacterium]|jgi:UDP-N-acetylglucosamine acyltransferase
MNIHPTAVVDPGARLADDAVIGAYAFVGPEVEIGPGCRIGHHTNIERNTSIGRDSEIWPFASLGTDPQDIKYDGTPTYLEIGKNAKIREFVTVNRGTVGGGGRTKVGDNCMLMAYSHVAHDCQLGEHVIMANSSTLGGHVNLGDYCYLGGMVAVHQFTRMGKYSFAGGMSGIDRDIPPFTLCEGRRARTHGLNIIGLKRAGFSLEAIEALKHAYRIIFRTRTPLQQALDEVRQEVADLPEVQYFLQFIESSKRGVAR